MSGAGKLHDLVSAAWYQGHPLGLALMPISWLYAGAVAAKRWTYEHGLLRAKRLSVPVIVVGNISVGGTGKTPLVIWLAQHLASLGYRVGILCRGYLGKAPAWPQLVTPDTDPAVAGDEAVVLARRSGRPVAAGPDRYEAGLALLARHALDVIVCDDGLQHLRLHRDAEIAVLDGLRRHGNQRLLPSGPLREPVRRLADVDLVVAKHAAGHGEFCMQVTAGDAINLSSPSRARALSSFRGHAVHAVCGIGHPDQFFTLLERAGLRLIRHAFPDHHPFAPNDMSFPDTLPVLMTEKDAVKCSAFAAERYWYVPIEARMSADFAAHFDALIASVAGLQCPRAEQLELG